MFVCATEGREKTVTERKMLEIIIRKEKWNAYFQKYTNVGQ